MMKMAFTFDKEAVMRRSYTMSNVYKSVKEEFARGGLQCISDGETLTFAGVGHADDYSNMLGMMRRLSRCEWFFDVLSSWHFTTDERKGWEDVLGQLKREVARGELPWATA